MKTYPDSLVQTLQQDQHFLDVDGIRIRVKAIPDDPTPGVLDRRDLACMQADHSADVPPDATGIQAVRDSMGFPARNLNTVEIHTKFESLTFGENTVGLWRYYPRKPERKQGRPAFIYIHGGGWVGGNTYVVENQCKLLAELADAVVFNIDYPLAPEAPYPQGFDACFDTINHIWAHAAAYGIDPNRIGIGGDSAGGNLSAACALKDRDLGHHHIRFQLLIYPLTTFVEDKTPGYVWKAEDYEIAPEQVDLLTPCITFGHETTEAHSDVFSCYFGDHPERAYEPYASPLLAQDFSNLPPALIVNAEYDGLRTQGEAYGRAMQRAGGQVEWIRYRGVTHSFFDKLGVCPQTEDLLLELAQRVAAL